MRRVLFVVLAFLTAAVQPAAAAEFSFVGLGDMPYRVPADHEPFRRLITRINQEKPVFSIHVGDTKGGSTPCTRDAYTIIRNDLITFEQPLFYTPGDNEWTDCHRYRAGDFDPLTRLAMVREIFFAEAQSLGKSAMAYERQADRSSHVQMVENALWRHSDVLFATVHVVGPNNGRKRSKSEYRARDEANADWIDHAFSEAMRMQARAAVIAFHADLWHKGSDKGIRKTLQRLARGAKAFAKPVLLINGDVHRHTIDQPLIGEDGAVLNNVTRLRVMGKSDLRAVKVTVAAPSQPAFRYEPLSPSER